uniref:Vacuolar protein sorting-associated protein 51 homolog n=1 Tax=Glossina palpalis gambiensis TaxID=67801 RepID=A0A1B0BQT7_9MUSC
MRREEWGIYYGKGFLSMQKSVDQSLSSARLSLVSAKSDSTTGSSLNDLITNLYGSLIEKLKGILQDLLVFLQTEWSFNIKSGSSSPNLLLVLSCLEMEQNGIHVLVSKLITSSKICLLIDLLTLSPITLIDEIDSENNATLTHATEVCSEMRETAQALLDTFVRLQGLNISQMLRKSCSSGNEACYTIILELHELHELHEASSDSSRKTLFRNLTNSEQQFRSSWSNYTPLQLQPSYLSYTHCLVSEKIDICSSVEFSKVSIVIGIIKISLKLLLLVNDLQTLLLESVQLRTFIKFGLQQIQVDTHYLQMNLWRFVKNEHLLNFLREEILVSAVRRCLESTLMQPNAAEIICERD